MPAGWLTRSGTAFIPHKVNVVSLLARRVLGCMLPNHSYIHRLPLHSGVMLIQLDPPTPGRLYSKAERSPEKGLRPLGLGRLKK